MQTFPDSLSEVNPKNKDAVDTKAETKIEKNIFKLGHAPPGENFFQYCKFSNARLHVECICARFVLAFESVMREKLCAPQWA